MDYPPSFSTIGLLLLLIFASLLTSTSPSVLRLPKYGDQPVESSACSTSDPSLYFSPVIGILSHPGDGASGRLTNASGTSYIAASYVKFVESAGARVVPLIYNEPFDIISQKLELVNGVLFTGGWKKSGLYFETAKKILQKVLERNDAGDHFPLFAICLGFEILSMIVSKDNNILERFDATAQASTLQFAEPDIDGTVFERFPAHLLSRLSKDCIVMQNHKYGISPKRLLGNPSLSAFFKIITTSTDSKNQAYVSTVQAHDYPISGFQWHPEKNAFEWGMSMIPHSEDAILVTQYTANYLVSEARRSVARPSPEKLLRNFIYNYHLSYSGCNGSGFDEVYLFP